jgi:hypothetical protein
MDGLSLHSRNQFFPLHVKIDIIGNYFSYLENKLGTKNYRVFLLGNFNVSGLD